MEISGINFYPFDFLKFGKFLPGSGKYFLWYILYGDVASPEH
jgi:hypothetical protein